MSEKDITAKQEFLRKEILEADCDANRFSEFLDSKKGKYKANIQ